MRGRKPKATHLKLIDGNPGKRPINKNEPVPIADIHLAPEHCTELEKTIWQHVIENAPSGMLKELDAELLYVWVCAAASHREARKALIGPEGESLHYLQSNKTGYRVPNPAHAVARGAAATMIKVAAELGFSPTSRSRLQVAPNRGNEKKASGFAQFKLRD